MQAAKHWNSMDDSATVIYHALGLRGLGNELPDTLMRPCVIELPNILLKHALQMLRTEDQDVIQTLPSDAPQKAFTDGIGTRRSIGCSEQLDPTTVGLAVAAPLIAMS